MSVKNLSFYPIYTYSLHWHTGSTGDCPVHSTEKPLCSGVSGAPETSLLHVHREPPPQHHCPRRFPQHLHHGNRQPQGLHCLRGQWGRCITKRVRLYWTKPPCCFEFLFTFTVNWVLHESLSWLWSLAKYSPHKYEQFNFWYSCKLLNNYMILSLEI